MQSESLEALLRAERQAQPEPGAEDRIWAALEHRLVHGPGPPGGADVAPTSLGGAASGGGVALKVLAGLALVATGIGVWSARAGDEPGPPAADVVAAAAIEPVLEDRREVPIEAVPEDRREAPAPALDPSPADGPEHAPEEEEPAVAAVKKPRAKARPESPKEDAAPVDFAAELQLIAEIRGALKRGDSAQALARVEEHARKFGARGQLVQERLAYHVEALCSAGRVDEARRVARDLLAKWPDSTHAPRVKKSCAGA